MITFKNIYENEIIDESKSPFEPLEELKSVLQKLGFEMEEQDYIKGKKALYFNSDKYNKRECGIDFNIDIINGKEGHKNIFLKVNGFGGPIFGSYGYGTQWFDDCLNDMKAINDVLPQILSCYKKICEEMSKKVNKIPYVRIMVNK